jgi:hypothetical protein
MTPMASAAIARVRTNVFCNLLEHFWRAHARFTNVRFFSHRDALAARLDRRIHRQTVHHRI